MRKFEWYDITCALTHSIETCEHCRKCGDDGAKIRLEMAEYVKALDNGFNKACEKLYDKGYNEQCKFKMCEVATTFYEGDYDKKICSSCHKEYLLSEVSK